MNVSRARTKLAYATGGFGLGISSMVALLVPLLGLELGYSTARIGVLVGLGSVAPMALSLPSGSMIDRVGAKRSFIVGAIGAGAILATFPLLEAFWQLALVQLAFGAARSLAWIASQTYITNLRTHGGSESVGKFSAIVNLGTLVGPALGGWVTQITSVHAAFFVAASLSVSFGLLGFGLVEDARRSSTGHRRHDAGLGVIVRLPAMQSALLFTFVRLWVNGTWNTFFPVLLIEAGASAGFVGIALSTRAAVATLSSWASDRISGTDRTRAGRLALALGVGIAGLALSPFALGSATAFLPAILVGASNGLSLPLLLLYLSEGLPAHRQGLGFGLRMTVNQVASAASPPLAGLLLGGLGGVVGFAVIGGVGVVALTGGLHRGRCMEEARG